jgi:hypothetical protein
MLSEWAGVRFEEEARNGKQAGDETGMQSRPAPMTIQLDVQPGAEAKAVLLAQLYDPRAASGEVVVSDALGHEQYAGGIDGRELL